MNAYEQEFEKEWKEVLKHKDQFFPNVMIAGSSGAGKSSLINRIFGIKVAEINDFTPETQGYNNIYYGKDYGTHVNLVDTAGYELGQADDYLRHIEDAISRGVDGNRIHVIWYCIEIPGRIEDMDIKTIKSLVNQPDIRKRLCVLFTKCDEDTPDGSTAKCFESIIDSKIGSNLKCFKISNDKEFPFDLDKLMDWTAEAIGDEDLRREFVSSQMANLELKRKEAIKIIGIASAAAAAEGAVPVPFSDSLMLIPTQTVMLYKIIDAYGVTNLISISSSLITDMVVSNIGKSIAGSLLKFLPVIGSIAGGMINAGVASALTGAIGGAASEICYNSVKQFLNGKDVSWDKIFTNKEFKNAVTNLFKQLFKKSIEE